MSTRLIACALALGLAASAAGCGDATKTVTVPVTRTVAPGTVTPTTQTPPTTPTDTVVLTTKSVNEPSFRSPTGNIGCIVASGIARCDLRKRDWPLPDRPGNCPTEVDYGQGLQVGRTGRGRVVCAGDTTLDPTATKLGYGTQSVVGPFTCVSQEAGMTCTNTRTGHGFFLSRQAYRVF